MNFTFLQRMNRRERVLASVVAGVVFVLVNLFLWSALVGGISRARADVADRNLRRAEQVIYLRDRDLWAKREDWLRQHQPVLKSQGEASTLLDQLKQAAGKYNILIENPSLGSGETTPNRQTVFASIETKSPWPPLVQFLYDVQQPEAFVVFETMNLAIDGNDPTMMRGKFKVARWYAPASRK